MTEETAQPSPPRAPESTSSERLVGYAKPVLAFFAIGFATMYVSLMSMSWVPEHRHAASWTFYAIQLLAVLSGSGWCIHKVELRHFRMEKYHIAVQWRVVCSAVGLASAIGLYLWWMWEPIYI